MDNFSIKLFYQKSLVIKALTLSKWPILISLIITPLRFSLELAGIPDNYIFIIGLLWLTLAFSVYWGIKLYQQKQAFLILLIGLCIFSPISRIPVAILWWVDNNLELGTHYGLFFDNWINALLNHIIYGSLVQIIPGFLLGSITIIIMKKMKSETIKSQTL